MVFTLPYKSFLRLRLLTGFHVYIYSFPFLSSIGNSTCYFVCNQVWNDSLGCIQWTFQCHLCSCSQHGFCCIPSEKWPNRACNSGPSILIPPHCKTSTLVYNHTARRTVIFVYYLRVTCFNLSNASNTWTNSFLTVVLPAKNSAANICNFLASPFISPGRYTTPSPFQPL